MNRRCVRGIGIIGTCLMSVLGCGLDDGEADPSSILTSDNENMENKGTTDVSYPLERDRFAHVTCRREPVSRDKKEEGSDGIMTYWIKAGSIQEYHIEIRPIQDDPNSDHKSPALSYNVVLLGSLRANVGNPHSEVTIRSLKIGERKGSEDGDGWRYDREEDCKILTESLKKELNGLDPQSMPSQITCSQSKENNDRGGWDIRTQAMFPSDGLTTNDGHHKVWDVVEREWWAMPLSSSTAATGRRSADPNWRACPQNIQDGQRSIGCISFRSDNDGKGVCRAILNNVYPFAVVVPTGTKTSQRSRTIAPVIPPTF